MKTITQSLATLLVMALLTTGCSSPNGGPSSSAIDRGFAHWQKGYELDKQGNLDGAIAEYTLAIQVNPTDTVAYNSRAHDKVQKKDYDGAIEDSGRVLALQPDDLGARMIRVLAERGKGDTNEAAKDQAIVDDQMAKWIRDRNTIRASAKHYTDGQAIPGVGTAIGDVYILPNGGCFGGEGTCGIHWSSGAQMMFGATISAQSPMSLVQPGSPATQ